MIHFAVFLFELAAHCEHNYHKDQAQDCTHAQGNKQKDIFDCFCKKGEKKCKEREGYKDLSDDSIRSTLPLDGIHF